ncbi:helix-turn-helix transcriptional regulator [Shewanella algidipiscicola]|uniref:Helix-turn-helix domain-containing protein n=1 Tax=Shewanella algidipiscicola TaxID=614070 RepID=A0ABQ4PG67_9GAMM|nr:hypothetical protein TUM4630_17280 [Shewanella algidipiscicola]
MTHITKDYLAQYLDENRLVKKPELQRLLGISRSTLGRWIKSGQFPPPVLIQSGRSFWRFKDIDQWLPNK